MNDDQNEPGGSRDGLDLDPLDLDRARPGFTTQDESVAAAFRSGLRPDEAQIQGLLARLPEIQRRARRRYRRRQMAGSALLAAVATTSAILLVNLPGGRGTAAVTPANTSTAQATATPVTRDSLLRTSQISAFGPGAIRQNTPSTSLDDKTLSSGICGSGTPWAAVPDRGWTAGWLAGDPPGGTAVAAGVAETVWQWDAADQADTLLDQLRTQVKECAGPGLEGPGATHGMLDSEFAPEFIQGLITTAPDGQGDQHVRVVMAEGGIVVELLFVIPDAATSSGSKATGTSQAVYGPILRAALKRIFGRSSGPTGPAAP